MARHRARRHHATPRLHRTGRRAGRECSRHAGLVLAAVIAVAGAGEAAQIAVTTTADSLVTNGACSLREALVNANADAQTHADCTGGSGTDTIVLPAGTFTLALAGTGEDAALSGDLDVTDSLVLRGQGAGVSIIDANGIDRVVHVLSGVASATFEDLTLTGGNVAASSAVGAGIYTTAALTTLRRCEVSSNTMTPTSFISAEGGGIFLSMDNTLVVEDSTIRDNSVTELDSNVAVRGGGISNGSSGGTVVIRRSTISGNQLAQGMNGASQGAGLKIAGTLTLENSTISGNSLTVNTGPGIGGGIAFSGGGGTLDHVTIAGNSAPDGPDLHIPGTSPDVKNTIVSGGGCSGSVNSLGGNVESPGDTCSIGGGTNDQSSVSSGALALGPLADNGGPTLTHALGASSAAIDQGTIAPCPTSDQRGFPRQAPCDSGAFERLEGLIHFDGFESGDTSGWSSAVG